MRKPSTPLIANILPRDARDALIAAAAVAPHVPPTESKERRCQVDDAIERIKFKYPQYFIEE